MAMTAGRIAAITKKRFEDWTLKEVMKLKRKPNANATPNIMKNAPAKLSAKNSIS